MISKSKIYDDYLQVKLAVYMALAEPASVAVLDYANCAEHDSFIDWLANPNVLASVDWYKSRSIIGSRYELCNGSCILLRPRTEAR